MMGTDIERACIAVNKAIVILSKIFPEARYELDEIEDEYTIILITIITTVDGDEAFVRYNKFLTHWVKQDVEARKYISFDVGFDC